MPDLATDRALPTQRPAHVVRVVVDVPPPAPVPVVAGEVKS